MNEDIYIGRHKSCGGRVIAWYQDGHYYYNSGIYCESCHSQFDKKDDPRIKPRIKFATPQQHLAHEANQV